MGHPIWFDPLNEMNQIVMSAWRGEKEEDGVGNAVCGECVGMV